MKRLTPLSAQTTPIQYATRNSENPNTMAAKATAYWQYLISPDLNVESTILWPQPLGRNRHAHQVGKNGQAIVDQFHDLTSQ
jgi:hypothetical protein